MVQIILKLLECKSMPIVELEEFISPTDYIAKKNCLQNSNYGYQSKNKIDYIKSKFTFL
jgi:hypothetical protein